MDRDMLGFLEFQTETVEAFKPMDLFKGREILKARPKPGAKLGFKA